VRNRYAKQVDRILLHPGCMTTCEWIYNQTILTDFDLENARTPDRREFVIKRLRELQGRVQFEQRQLARSEPDTSMAEELGW
jgi:hypothetical protein